MSIKGYDDWKLASGPSHKECKCPDCGSNLGRDGDYCQICGWYIDEWGNEGNEYDEADREIK